MPFQIIRNDITKVRADAIVNTANPFPIVGDGTDTAIYQAAGWDELLAERAKIGIIKPGHTEYTSAFHLRAKYIFHSVGPEWIDGKQGERKTLRASYRSALALAVKLSCRSIAFPLMASGSYRFPKDVALKIALDEIQKFLLDHEMRILLVVFDREAFELSGKLVGKIDEYIDEHAVDRLHYQEYGEWFADRYDRRYGSKGQSSHRLTLESRRLGADEESWQSQALSLGGDYWKLKKESKSLEDILDDTGNTFQQKLLKLIDESGLNDAAVYKKANISKQLFSKIRSKEDYAPKKKTVVAFAIALQLDMDETKDLLMRAGYALSPSSKFDLIVSYFITHHNYDIYMINSTLFQYDQPLLGA